MANGEDDGSKSSSSDPSRGKERDIARGREEELGRAERARDAAEARFEAIKAIATQEGRIMDALTAQIEKQKELSQYQIDYGKLQEPQLTNERLKLRTLEAQSEVIKDTTASADKLLSKMKSMAEIPDVKAAQYFDNMAAAIAGMTANLDDAEGGSSSLGEALGGVVKDSFNLNTALNLVGRSLITVAATGLTMMVTQTIKLAKAADSATAAFTAQTGIVGNLRDDIVQISRDNLSLGISMEDAAAATTSLTTGFGEFVALSPSVQKSLSEDAAQMQKIGLSTDTFAASINELNKSLGLTPADASAATKSLSALGIELGIGADKINQDFVASLPQLRVYGDRAVEVFSELSVAAREAGVQVSSLTNILGEQFNTFEGSARVAGRLNAVLGTDMFSSTELLMATESERLDILKERLAMSGVEFTNLSKFQQLALANAAGISDVNEAAKIFGNTQSEVAMKVGGLALTQEELEGRIQTGRNVTQKLEFALMSLAVAFEPVADAIAFVSNLLVKFSESMGGAGGVALAIGLVVAGLTGFGLLIVRSVGLFKSARTAAMEFAATQALSAKATAELNRQLARQNVLAGARGGGLRGTRGSISPTARASAGAAANRSAFFAQSRAADAARGAPPVPPAPAAPAAGVGGRLAKAAAGIGKGIVGLLVSMFIGPIVEKIASFFGADAGLAGKLGSGATDVATFASYGAMIGSFIPIPGVGAGIGAGIGAALGLAKSVASAQEGGITTQEGLVNVHPQEAIVPLDQLMGKFDELISAVKVPTSGEGGGNIVVQVMLNERQLGEAVVPIIDRRVLGTS